MKLSLNILTFLKGLFYTKTEVDEKLGDIETILDEIIGVQCYDYSGQVNGDQRGESEYKECY